MSDKKSPLSETAPADETANGGDATENMDDATAEKTKLTSSDSGVTAVVYSNAASGPLNKNGEAKVDICGGLVSSVGLTKDELMKCATDPFWIRLRLFLFIGFWALWFLMLIGAVIIIVVTPRCPPPPTLDWWQKTALHQVYVKSFKDSSGDGTGDLNGVASKVDYLKSLHTTGVILSPIYPSGGKDNGYDVTDYMAVDPHYGDLEDFDKLLEKLHLEGIRVVVDLIPNHSSNKHPWFTKSEDRSDPKYENYYVWKTGSSGSPPNNWKSVFGGSAWTWSQTRRAWYLHQFLPEQPDLNLREEAVKEEIKQIAKFWLDRKVDGFRIDAASHLFEDKDLRDEPSISGKSGYDSLDHIYTKGQPETLEFLKEMRELLNNYTTEEDYKVLLVEVTEGEGNIKYYGSEKEVICDVPFNFDLLELKPDFKPLDLYNIFDGFMNRTTKWPNWVLGNHDNSRLASRVGDDMVDAIFMAAILNRGTAISYYGDEIGMQDTLVPPNRKQDQAAKPGGVESRDAFRTPMQWDASANAGFSSADRTWLPVGANYTNVNVEAQKGDAPSHLKVFQKLMELREEPAVAFGNVSYPILDDTIFSFLRVRKGSPAYLVIINTGTEERKLNFVNTDKHIPDEKAEVEALSINVRSGPLTGSHKHIKVPLSNVVLGGRQAAVVSLVPKFD